MFRQETELNELFRYETKDAKTSWVNFYKDQYFKLL